MTQVAVRLDETEMAALDELVRSGRFASRAAAIRSALAGQRRAELDRAIESAYARGYGDHPQRADALPDSVVRSAIAQSTDSQSTDSQSTDSQSTDSQSTDSQSTDSQSTDSQSTDSHGDNAG